MRQQRQHNNSGQASAPPHHQHQHFGMPSMVSATPPPSMPMQSLMNTNPYQTFPTAPPGVASAPATFMPTIMDGQPLFVVPTQLGPPSAPQPHHGQFDQQPISMPPPQNRQFPLPPPQMPSQHTPLMQQSMLSQQSMPPPPHSIPVTMVDGGQQVFFQLPSAPPHHGQFEQQQMMHRQFSLPPPQMPPQHTQMMQQPMQAPHSIPVTMVEGGQPVFFQLGHPSAPPHLGQFDQQPMLPPQPPSRQFSLPPPQQQTQQQQTAASLLQNQIFAQPSMPLPHSLAMVDGQQLKPLGDIYTEMPTNLLFNQVKREMALANAMENDKTSSEMFSAVSVELQQTVVKQEKNGGGGNGSEKTHMVSRSGYEKGPHGRDGTQSKWANGNGQQPANNNYYAQNKSGQYHQRGNNNNNQNRRFTQSPAGGGHYQQNQQQQSYARPPSNPNLQTGGGGGATRGGQQLQQTPSLLQNQIPVQSSVPPHSMSTTVDGQEQPPKPLGDVYTEIPNLINQVKQKMDLASAVESDKTSSEVFSAVSVELSAQQTVVKQEKNGGGGGNGKNMDGLSEKTHMVSKTGYEKGPPSHGGTQSKWATNNGNGPQQPANNNYYAQNKSGQYHRRSHDSGNFNPQQNRRFAPSPTGTGGGGHYQQNQQQQLYARPPSNPSMQTGGGGARGGPPQQYQMPSQDVRTQSGPCDHCHKMGHNWWQCFEVKKESLECNEFARVFAERSMHPAFVSNNNNPMDAVGGGGGGGRGGAGGGGLNGIGGGGGGTFAGQQHQRPRQHNNYYHRQNFYRRGS